MLPVLRLTCFWIEIEICPSSVCVHVCVLLGLALSVEDSHGWEASLELPRGLKELIRHIHSTKWQLIRRRQELTRSYKEVCAPVMERCRLVMVEECFTVFVYLSLVLCIHQRTSKHPLF